MYTEYVIKANIKVNSSVYIWRSTCKYTAGVNVKYVALKRGLIQS